MVADSTPKAALKLPAGISRRRSDETRQELLEAAAGFLERHPFRDLTIPGLMALTTVGRSSFYTHFKDIYSVIEALLVGVRDRVLADLKLWAVETKAPIEGLKSLVIHMVAVWEEHGPMLSALIDAAPKDARLEHLQQEIQHLYQLTIAAILRRDHAAGWIDLMDFDEVALILVVASQAYLKGKLGRLGPHQPETVISTLQMVWTRTIFGRAPDCATGTRPVGNVGAAWLAE